MVLRSDPTVYPNTALNLDMLRLNPKLYAQMVNTRIFYEKLKQKERASKLLNQLYSGQATEERPVVYDFPVDRQLDTKIPEKSESISIEDVYFTTSSPVKLPKEVKETSAERSSLLKRHKSDVNIKALRIAPQLMKKRIYNYPKKYQQKYSYTKKPFVIKAR